MPDFLLEIGCEEIPARMIGPASEELLRRTLDLLKRERLAGRGPALPFSTPRRISVLISGMRARQDDCEEQLQGPSLKIAYREGAPTPAAHAFAKKAGVDVAKLEKVVTAKGEYLSARVTKKGRAACEVLSELLPREIGGLYWAKNMYWRPHAPERFVRPVRWLVAMLDEEVVPLEFAGVKARAISRGHRLLGDEVLLKSAAAYKASLEKVRVLADAGEREQRIRQALDAATRQVAGCRWREDKNLVNTVVNLTEWPSAVLGSFDQEFLALPGEVLVTVMRDHQKYFAVEDSVGNLAAHFLAVLNTDGDPDGLVRHGNERVLRARFSDARFFWQADQRIPLHDRVEGLKAVTFQRDLGSYYEKSQRVEKLAETLAAMQPANVPVDHGALKEAARLAKTDLTTELVKEFTELQGVVGGLYARAQGLSPAVSRAIYDQYKPQSMEDEVPRTIEGALLSIADKADTVAGMFALGLQPTGSKDPFALRRQANGIVRIIAEFPLKLNVTDALNAAFRTHATFSGKPFPDALNAFARERVEFYLREKVGIAYDVVRAVLASPEWYDVNDVIARSAALSQARNSADFEAIAVSFKRIKNILRQAQGSQQSLVSALRAAELVEESEKELFKGLTDIAALCEPLRQQRKYAQALAEISRLRPALDSFFEKVMVMVDDPELRSNRLALLQRLLDDFSTIADFSEIVTERRAP